MASWLSRVRLPLNSARSFDSLVIPHLNAGYNLARWLLRDVSSAEDAVQEATLRAFRYFHAVRGDDARAWFLGIVRNTCFTHLSQSNALMEQSGLEDNELAFLQATVGDVGPDPSHTFERACEGTQVNQAIRALPPLLREVIVLRELQELDYAAIATVVDIPIGTVMSRLSRARDQLRLSLAKDGWN